ncbi:hypothetical protein DEU56DRAFT_826671 [Suillus clintonianus]|uniref:uncharacterized protein n=1 Tax=Suillus clintonianus TaxID=1904413 RepID=UPI001B880531|nr:uncharacterized protein DEU56DRAFT_826671 [Suillus clintonianus]KAG2124821.1 hypothetical protein DEU56DRAFT_826671 [Suillus clintonianus]
MVDINLRKNPHFLHYIPHRCCRMVAKIFAFLSVLAVYAMAAPFPVGGETYAAVAASETDFGSCWLGKRHVMDRFRLKELWRNHNR